MMNILYVMDLLGDGGVEKMTLHWVSRIAGGDVKIDFVVRDVESRENERILSEKGCRIYRMPFTYRHFLKRKRLLKSIMGKTRYDIIHVHGATGVDFLIYKWAKEAGIPVRIAHSHNADCVFRHWYSGILHKIMKRFIPVYATAFLGCSKDACEFYYGSVPGARVILNGIDTGVFRFCNENREHMRRRYHVEDKIVYGSVGRCEKQKNHEFLLDIYSELLKRQPNAFFLLIGHGSLDEMIEKKISALGLDRHFIWVKQTGKVSDYMAMMDVFVFPSLYEGLGIVGVEAQSMGLPVLISEEAYHEEIGVTKLLHRMELRRGAGEWARRCMELSQNQGAAREGCSDLVEKAGYSIEASADRLKEIYDSELKRMSRSCAGKKQKGITAG